MTDVWRSTKKWTCKYCDITINDDAPSRNLHENGFRHINAKERHLRQIYKSGAEKKRAAELETREMERIERAAAIAHARDTGGPMPTFAPSSSSRPPPAAGPKASGSGGAYTSAADLGYTPQQEAGRTTKARDETVGQAGEWEVVAPPPERSLPPQAEVDAAEAEGSATIDSAASARPPARKREFGSTADDNDLEEARSFKFKRKERQAYLDDDDDLPEIKLKQPAGAAAVKQELEPLPGFRGVEWGSRLPVEVVSTPRTEAEATNAPNVPLEAKAGDLKPVVKDEPDVSPALPPPEGGGMFKKRRGPPKGVGKRPTV